MKKLLPWFGVALLGISVFYFFLKNSKSPSGPSNTVSATAENYDGKVYFDYTSLPKGVMAQSGDFQVLRKEVYNTSAMKALEAQKREVLFSLFYRQFVSYSKEKIKRIELSIKPLGLSPSAIINRYGIPFKAEIPIEFKAFKPSQGFARIDGKVISKQDINTENFIYGVLETQIFHYKLNRIDKMLKGKYLVAESKKVGLSVDQYREEHVYKKLVKEISANDINKYLKKYNIEDTDRNRKSAANRLLELRKQRALDYILEKYVMKFPIQVGFQIPPYKIEANEKWTPILGDNSRGLQMTLFSDTRGSVSSSLIEELTPLVAKYKDLRFEYRPLFRSSDELQNLTTHMHFCVLMKYRDQFWDYFKQSLGDFRSVTEAKLYEISDQMGLDTSDLKKCVLAKEFKEVIDYHSKYAKYLGLEVGPILYVNGEIFQGSVDVSRVEKVLRRQLRLPAAGVWKK